MNSVTKKLLLRKATVADSAAICKIYLESRKKLVAFAPLVHSDESVFRWILNILIPNSEVIVAEEGGIIIAMMALSKKENIGWIDQLYLSPEVVGRGIGTQLT